MNSYHLFLFTHYLFLAIIVHFFILSYLLTYSPKLCPSFFFLSFEYQLMELELKKLHDTINSIHEEMFYLRDRCDTSVCTSIFKVVSKISFGVPLWRYRLYVSLLNSSGKKKCRNLTERPTPKWRGWVAFRFLFACLWLACNYGTSRHFSRKRSSSRYIRTTFHNFCFLYHTWS